MAKGSLQIDLLGASFAIQADEKPEYLQAIYDYYKKTINHIERTAGIKEPVKAAIMAGILISDELFKEKLKHPGQTTLKELSEAEALALKMISRIDQAIKE